MHISTFLTANSIRKCFLNVTDAWIKCKMKYSTFYLAIFCIYHFSNHLLPPSHIDSQMENSLQEQHIT